MATQTDSGSILVIDDETNIRRTLALVLEGEGFEVVGAPSAEDGLALLARRRFDAVMLDVCLPGMDGLTALEAILTDDANLPVVMISGHASIRDAVRATRLGAFDFLEKPLGRERVLVSLRNCVRRAKELEELASLRAERNQRASILLGESPAMVKLRAQIAKVAPTKGRVLITGESGTGKELVAREVHEQSDRASRPFIKVNCAAIPGELIESSLFGHERGAFTSAVGRRRGHFEQADRGTLFLDEIGDMSLSAQAKLLRVLQTGELTRVGGEQTMDVSAHDEAVLGQGAVGSRRQGQPGPRQAVAGRLAHVHFVARDRLAMDRVRSDGGPQGLGLADHRIDGEQPESFDDGGRAFDATGIGQRAAQHLIAAA